MSAKTLTDELRSVLLFHSLEAPQPNATVDRILNDTVGAVVALGSAAPAAGTADGDSARPARQLSVQQLVAASVVAVLLLAVAGINSVRNRNAVQTANQASRNEAGFPASDNAVSGSMVLPEASGSSQAKAGAASPPGHVGKALNCSGIPGGRLITGKWDQYRLSTGKQGYLYEFLCVGLNGQRSASEVQMFQQTGLALDYVATVLRADLGQHLDFLTTGADSVRIQASVHSAASGRVPGEVVSTAWDLSAAVLGDGQSFSVAGPCLPDDLAGAVVEVPDAAVPSWRLTLRNRAATACGLEGYPQVRAQLAGVPLATAVPTLSGTAGGITKAPVPPIIVLSPDATASAIIEQSAVSATGSCPRADQLAVTLPTGASLGLLPAGLAGCGLAVHPLVGNARGSD
jgi:hypothetical protein